jgi:hypothetical protein
LYIFCIIFFLILNKLAEQWLVRRRDPFTADNLRPADVSQAAHGGAGSGHAGELLALAGRRFCAPVVQQGVVEALAEPREMALVEADRVPKLVPGGQQSLVQALRLFQGVECGLESKRYYYYFKFMCILFDIYVYF